MTTLVMICTVRNKILRHVLFDKPTNEVVVLEPVTPIYTFVIFQTQTDHITSLQGQRGVNAGLDDSIMVMPGSVIAFFSYFAPFHVFDFFLDVNGMMLVFNCYCGSKIIEAWNGCCEGSC